MRDYEGQPWIESNTAVGLISWGLFAFSAASFYFSYRCFRVLIRP